MFLPAVSFRSAETASLAGWMKTEATVRLPRWAFVAAGLVVFALLLLALD